MIRTIIIGNYKLGRCEMPYVVSQPKLDPRSSEYCWAKIARRREHWTDGSDSFHGRGGPCGRWCGCCISWLRTSYVQVDLKRGRFSLSGPRLGNSPARLRRQNPRRHFGGFKECEGHNRPKPAILHFFQSEAHQRSGHDPFTRFVATNVKRAVGVNRVFCCHEESLDLVCRCPGLVRSWPFAFVRAFSFPPPPPRDLLDRLAQTSFAFVCTPERSSIYFL
jgi:hypothetical protein